MSSAHLGRSRRGRMPVTAEINVIALMDVTLVLLVIFMITAPIMQGGIEVQLPRAEARPITQNDGVIVSVDQQGQIFIDRTAVSYEEFRATFRALVQSRNADAVTLRADSRVPYGQVARVLGVIRETGVANVGLVTEQEDIR
ncbi:MAG: biopolymer transporter ExbD [Gemmatimonadota bacterium]|nr:biopolymer transporter ExbD [Gemmatimonadota bacterium]